MDLARRIALLESRLASLANLRNLEFLAPLHLDSTAGAGTAVTFDETPETYVALTKETLPARSITTTTVGALNGAINDTVTSITVSPAINPTALPFVLTIEDEQVLVTEFANSLLTVQRGFGGTTAAAHADGTNVDIADVTLGSGSAIIYKAALLVSGNWGVSSTGREATIYNPFDTAVAAGTLVHVLREPTSGLLLVVHGSGSDGDGDGDDSCCGCQVATASWRHGTNTEDSPSTLHLQADPPASRSVDAVVELSGPGMVDLTTDDPQTYPYEFEFTIPEGVTDPLTIEIWSHGGDGYFGEFGLGVWDGDEVTTFETFNNFGGGSGTYRKLVIEEPVPGDVYLIRMYYNDVRGTQVLKDDVVILQAPAGNDGNPDLAYTTAGQGGQEASGIGGMGYSGGDTSSDAPHTNFIIADETGEYHDVSAQDAHDLGAVMGFSAGTAGGSGGGAPGPNGAGQDGTRKIIPGSGFEALFPFGAVESFLGGLGYRKGGNGAVFDRGNITHAQDGVSPGGGGGGSGLFLEADDTYQSNGYPVGIGGAAKVRISWLPCQEDVLDIVADNLALNVAPIGGGVYQVTFTGPIPIEYGGSGADLSAYPAGVVIKATSSSPLSVVPTVSPAMGGLGIDASGAMTGQAPVWNGSAFVMTAVGDLSSSSSSSVDNSIPRFDGITGKVIQGGYTSGAPTISDTGVATFHTSDSVAVGLFINSADVNGAAGIVGTTDGNSTLPTYGVEGSTNSPNNDSHGGFFAPATDAQAGLGTYTMDIYGVPGPPDPPTTAAARVWAENGRLYGMDNSGNIFGPIGAETIIEAENKDGSTVDAGSTVATHSSGIGFVRADGSDPTLPCIGLLRADTANTMSGLVQVAGPFRLADWTAIVGSATLTARAVYFLDPTTPGMLTTTVPTTAGQILQEVGIAVSSDTLDLTLQQPVLL